MHHFYQEESLKNNVSISDDVILFPASYAQERLWFLDQWAAEATVYLVPTRLRLYGPLQVQALRSSLEVLIQRHEILRTSFALHEGQLVQLIAPAVSLPFELVDVTELPSTEEQEAELRRISVQQATLPFDLRQAPLLRVVLVRFSTQHHVLLLTLHHIVADGWSLSILTQELNELYSAQVQGREPQLPQLAIQYADYAVWQREWLQGAAWEEHLRYWRQQLAGLPASLDLPTDHAYPSVQSTQGAHLRFRLPDELAHQLQQCCQQLAVTPFMLLLAAFQLVLARYSGQTDIAVGTPIANRQRKELEGVLGCFVNTLVLRTDLSGDPTGHELLQRVKQVALQAYAHQDMPFERLVEEMRPRRDASRPPLVQVLFTIQNTPQPRLALHRLETGYLERESETAKFELSLGVMQQEQGNWWVEWEYSRTLFEEPRIRRMQQHWQQIVKELVERLEEPISHYELLSPDERKQVLQEWNATERPYPGQHDLHEVFEEQVEHTPEAIALVYEQEHLSYAALNQRANQLAHYLRERGVGPEIRVGVCLERSLELVIGLLGVLKAGGAYVPLDPEYPQERLAYMLSDAQVMVVLTQTSVQAQLPHSGVDSIYLDTFWDREREEPVTNLQLIASPDRLAYVMYTSGSTGRPKGVEVRHRSILRLVFGMEFIPLESGQTLLQLAPTAFDASTFEIWGALLYGGRCILYPVEMPTARGIRTILDTQGVTILWLTASLFNLVMDEEPETFRGLHALLIGGEALSVPHVRRALAHLSTTRLINGYGPTESTTFTCCYCLPTSLSEDVRSIPLGVPIGNTRVYVLDKYLNIVPTGVTGELYIGGDGLARGYLNRPELTAEKFVPDSFSGQPGARLYRTGDRVCWRGDGTLEFLGRLDQQIKLRGYRIEPGEIESALRALPEVRECVVVTHQEPGQHEPRLVAYLLPQHAEQEEPSNDELHMALRKSLPDYMVPSAFVWLESWPLTPNGKLDRGALPKPQWQSSQGYVSPRTPTEEVLCAIWQEVLHVERVGIHDNFFELGGHSLLATQVIARVREAWQCEVPLHALFEAPSIAAFSLLIGKGSASSRAEPPIVALPVRPDPLPASYAQERLWFLDQWAPEAAVYLIPRRLRLYGPLQVQALLHSLEALVQRHESLRTSFALHEGQLVQLIAPTVSLPFELVDVTHCSALEEQEAELRRISVQQATLPFDLEQAPLLRVVLVRLGTQHHVLLLTLHHIIADGWSLSILTQELNELYSAQVQGREPQLPQLAIQYADYAVWQREWLQGAVWDEHLRYWHQQLAELPAALDLPTDHAYPMFQSTQGACLRMRLPDELTQQIQQGCQRAGVTPFMLLLAAFQVVLARYSGQMDIAVGTPIANRQRKELEGVLGCFVNTLVLRTDLSGDPTGHELLQRVKQMALQAYDYQDMPFERLVEEMRPQRDASRPPLVQVLFSMQNTPQPRLTLPGVVAEAMEREGEIARFEVSLTVIQEEQGAWWVEWEYSRALFEQERIRRMQQHWQQMVRELVERPDETISQYELLTSTERRQLLQEWNATRQEYVQQRCLHELFEEQVERTPEAIALLYEQEHLSYAALNQRANQLAHALQERGVGPEVRVGLCLERSPELVIGLLGVLKAGGAYVPLDPEYPQERLAYMLTDAQMRCVLTRRPIWSRLAEVELSTVEMLCVEECAQEWEQCRASNPRVGVKAQNLAYVIYTSGSTGRPKGVAIQHRSVINCLSSMGREPGLEKSDVFLATTSLSFDIAALELFLPLMIGAKLVIAQRATLNKKSIQEQITEAGITTMQATPTAWRLFLNTEWFDAHLPRILCGGEMLSRDLAEELLKRSTTLWNMYGPTETTIWSAVYQVVSETEERAAVSIGKPIANTQVYVLDAQGHPQPIGVPGELCIGGAGLARGYLNRPELTAEKFVPDPFSGQPGARLYRTGDRARWCANGTLELLGRLDQQVKLHGYRIEPAEIESVLRELPEVRECVVLLHQAVRQHEPRLVAYLLPQQAGEELTVSQLRAALSRRLPDYMVPSTFVWLESWPQTPNGKLDRRGLPAPQWQSHQGYVPPRTPTEEAVSTIWQEVLHVERVGIYDNFFELGGDSIISIQIITRANQVGLPITVKHLFQYQTVAELAAAMPAIPASSQAQSDDVKHSVSSNFPLAQLDERTLDKLFARIDEKDKAEESSL